MLAAVRFDPELHKELIEYIENYRDGKNRPNHSEAIRNLMQKGLEVTNQPQVTPNIDIDSIKQDIFNQVMALINKNETQSPSLPLPKNQSVTHDRVFTKVNNDVVAEKPKPQPKQPANINPLLANILGNSQR